MINRIKGYKYFNIRMTIIKEVSNNTQLEKMKGVTILRDNKTYNNSAETKSNKSKAQKKYSRE